MISINIQGLKDGKHKFEEKLSIESLEAFPEEFSGEVFAVGELQKHGDSYVVTGRAECLATFICDLSLEIYEEKISIDYVYLFNSDAGSVGSTENVQLISKDSKEIDITDEIRQDFIMALPMKRISPKYRGKNFEDIHPELTAVSDTQGASVWDALRKLTINN